VRSLDGLPLGYADLVQNATGDRVTAKLNFHFKDGSLREETTVYTERQFLRLVSNHVVMKGPAFQMAMESTIDAQTGQVRVRYTDNDGHEKVIEKRMDMPDDLANGLLMVLLKNIAPEAPKTTVSILAFTPDPRMVKLEFTRGADDVFYVSGSKRTALRYVVKVNVPGVVGVVASVPGKTPSDSQVWILGGEAPTFVKAETGAFSGGTGGSIWRLELASPTWPQTGKAPQARRPKARK
jgi:hypothetical protein